MVGIGITESGSKLHINGDFNIEGNLKFGEELIYNASAGGSNGWTFNTPVSVVNPEADNHAMPKKYLLTIVNNLDPCGTIMTDSRDDNKYGTVRIGTQCWMAENLKYLPEVFGAENGGTASPYYYVYDYEYDATKTMSENVLAAKEEKTYEDNGVLYNHLAASRSCPEGWRLPSHYDWIVLERAVCTAGEVTCAERFPYDISTEGKRGNNEDATLKNGDFKAKMSGYYDYLSSSFDGSASKIGFCSSTLSLSDSISNTWRHYLDSNDSGGVFRVITSKADGYSVRCLKN
jgi:uncharacterized protein (TIGR02145 family)